jgi:hypothetical protein
MTIVKVGKRLRKAAGLALVALAVNGLWAIDIHLHDDHQNTHPRRSA